MRVHMHTCSAHMHMHTYTCTHAHAHMHMRMHMHTWYLSTQPAVPTHAFCFRTAPVQNTTNAAVELFGDGQLDWIYLDATHTYAEARNDLERWYPKVSQLSQAVVGGRRGTREWALLGGSPSPHSSRPCSRCGGAGSSRGTITSSSLRRWAGAPR